MFDKRGKNPAEKPCNTIDTLIGVKAELQGDIVFSGGLRIDGKVKGNITAEGDSSSTLVLSEQSVVSGNINVPHVVINGVVKGHVRAAERIELQVKANITGDITYKTIQMALGAAINGKLIHEDAQQAPVALLKAVSKAGGETE